jgi:hypothetical protein
MYRHSEAKTEILKAIATTLHTACAGVARFKRRA